MAGQIIGILIAALLSQNFILVKFFGICPFMGVSKKIDTALGMGAAGTFVMALASAVDGICQGIGYTGALVIVCVIRELLGSGTFGGGILNGGEGIRILPEGVPAMQMVMPVGGFLVLGCVIAGWQALMKSIEKKNKKKEAAK